MKFEVGTTAITDGTSDVADRTPQPRLIIYPDGYGAPVHALPGDYVVVAGVNNPPDVTERGHATFEPTHLRYCGPNEHIAYLTARDELSQRTMEEVNQLKADLKPLPTCYLYKVRETIPEGNVFMSEVAPWNVWVHRPAGDDEEQINSMIRFLERSLNCDD